MVLTMLFREIGLWACGYKKTGQRCQVRTWLSFDLMKVENVLTWRNGQAKRKLFPRKQPEQNSAIFLLNYGKNKK